MDYASQPAAPIPNEIRPEPPRRQRISIIGIILVITGSLLLANNLGWLWWFDWGLYWPVLLIILGVLVLLRRTGRA